MFIWVLYILMKFSMFVYNVMFWYNIDVEFFQNWCKYFVIFLIIKNKWFENMFGFIVYYFNKVFIFILFVFFLF